MLPLKLLNTPLKKPLPGLIKFHYEPVCSLAYNKSLLDSPNSVYPNRKQPIEMQYVRLLHVTQVNRDLDTAFKSLGAGVAVTAIIGPGIGMGLVFGNMLAGVARNPSVANQLFQYAIMGAAFCESLAFFSLGVAFMLIA